MLPVSVETGLTLDDVGRLASRLFMEDDESFDLALIRVADPLDGLREFLASAPNKRPSRLIISLPTDGDGLGRRRRESAASS